MTEQPTGQPQRWKKPQKYSTKTDTPPKMIGYYSVDGKRNFSPDSSGLLYFNPPKDGHVQLDLNEGIETAVRRDESFESEGLDHIFEWLKLNHRKIMANPQHGRRLQPKFVCTCGTLAKMLTSRFLEKENWTIYAAMVKGTIYLCVDRSKKHVLAAQDKNDMYSSWGYKFEQYVLSAAPNKTPDTTKPVLETAEFRGVYRRRIGNFPILFTAIIKGVRSQKTFKDPLPLDKLEVIQTKTCKIIEHAGHDRCVRRFKFLAWWAQCWVANVSEILCGYRDESGIVQKLERHSLTEIIEKGEPYWDPQNCIDFCKTFLTTVSKTVVNEFNETLYKFEKVPDQGIKITRLPAENQQSFIPEWFVELLE